MYFVRSVLSYTVLNSTVKNIYTVLYTCKIIHEENQRSFCTLEKYQAASSRDEFADTDLSLQETNDLAATLGGRRLKSKATRFAGHFLFEYLDNI